MQIRDLVTINHNGLVADAVNLNMMADPDKNLRLCQGFVFNYDGDRPKSSTLGVVDAVRLSFHSANHDNIHLMVQDFGKGKSHFALTLANFFKQPADSPEVAGILAQMGYAVSGRSQAVVETLKAFKERSKPYLVVCISGETAADLGKLLLQGLQSALAEHGIQDTLAQRFTERPLRFLQNLSAEQRSRAEAFLAEQDPPYGLDDLIELLQEGQYELIPTVRELSQEFYGDPLDFQQNLDIEAILKDTIDQLCTGPDSRFSGLLILFDELNAYLRKWLQNPNAAGGWVLQNLTNACANHKGRLAMLCLAQVRPSIDRDVSAFDRKRYERFTTRIELATSTYEPQSSLELVMDNLLNQSNANTWQDFRQQWGKDLLSESRRAYDKYITAYSNRNWPYDDFHKHLGLGCYPLHPLTAYLLCNLEFTQGRTAIQFIKEDVAKFIETSPVETEGYLNYVRPVQLLDAFVSNFSQKQSYADYKKAYDAIAASATPDEVTVLRAIALYYLSEQKLKKGEREPHEELLAMMTGFSVPKTSALLKKLVNTYQVIYHNPGNQTYRFYSGFSINDLRRKIEEEIENTPPDFGDLIAHARKNLGQYRDDVVVYANQFVNKHSLNRDEWQFSCNVFSVDTLQRSLSSDRIIAGLSARGLIAYFLGETDRDLETLRNQAKAELDKAPQTVRDRIILAIPGRATRDLARQLQMREALNNKSVAEKQEFGPAVAELTKQLDQYIDTALKEIFSSCTYICQVMDKVPLAEQNKLETVVCAMLDHLYSFVPPVESNDKLRSNSTTGSTVVSYASRQLLAHDLKKPFPNKGYETLIDAVFVRRWGLLKSGTPYTVQVPTNPNIREAWDRISEMAELGDREQISIEIAEIWKRLRDAPFGHNELTFTMLFAAWLAHHCAEVELSGSFGIPKRRNEQVSVKTAPIHEWVHTNILEKPKEFIQEWVIKGRNKLVRRRPFDLSVPDTLDYDEASTLLQQIAAQLESQRLDPAKSRVLAQKRQQIQAGMNAIDQWFAPTQRAIALLQPPTQNPPPLEALAKLYGPLEIAPPSPDSSSPGVTQVHPSESQLAEWQNAIQGLRTRLEVQVEAATTQIQTLSTLEEAYRHQSDVERYIHALAEISELPSRFCDSLRTALQQVEQRIRELQETEQVQQRLEQIRQLYDTLTPGSPQSAYRRIQSEIQDIAAQCPAVQEMPDYQTILSGIEEKRESLIRRIAQWEGRFLPTLSKAEALQLNQEILQELSRFDEETSQQQLRNLIDRIQAKILDDESVEDEEKALKAAIQTAQQAKQSATERKSLGDAMQAYDDLMRLSLPPTNRIDPSPYQQQLDTLRAESKRAIAQKFEQLFQACDRELKKAEEYSKLKGYVQNAQALIAERPDFAELQERLNLAGQSLERQFAEWRKRAEDQQTLREIQQIKLSNVHTVLQCDQALAELTNHQGRLHSPEQFADVIQQLVQGLQAKRAELVAKLEAIAHKIETLTDRTTLNQVRQAIAKLEFVFKDSSDFSRYEQLAARLWEVGAAVEQVAQLEDAYRKVSSIAECEEAIARLAQEREKLSSDNPLLPRIHQLEQSILAARQSFIETLQNWPTQLEQASTLKDICDIQKQLLAKAAQYEDSEYKQHYDSLRQDVEQLTALYQILDIQQNDSLENCQAELERLQKWKAAQINLSPLVEKHYVASYETLDQTQQSIQQRHQQAANDWLAEMSSRTEHLKQLPPGEPSLTLANELLSEIRRNRSQHEAFLTADQQTTLRHILETCQAVQNQDRASKILSLFQELPRDQRHRIYQRLADYLEGTTERF
ncbi:MAG: hypothetical protein IGS50_15425 [Synechococcales cyanobacterium C42_A2020_086]|jgi:hypothetical protein|nr:hypothetical protein [Synechococcales cyanobacterium C42_A2020_086]